MPSDSASCATGHYGLCDAAHPYCATAIVTVLLVAPLSTTCTGRSSPAGALPGTMALICQTPTKPGASPLKRIRAGRPPMVAVGAPMVVDSGVAGAARSTLGERSSTGTPS